ncbi:MULTISPECIES: family 16 glycoside hydrolase [Chitinophagaceae]
MKRILLSLTCLFSLANMAHSQSIEPDLQDNSKWMMINRSVQPMNDGTKKGVAFNALPNDGAMVLKDYTFSNGTIEFDVKGKNIVQQSFVGIAFHGIDETHFDAVYFRPFNFKSTEDGRRAHSVQYISMPDYDWEKLRTQFPGKYENYVNPAPDPDAWFHVKIVVQEKHVTVYVNNNPQPVLEIDKLDDVTDGAVALWVGNNSDGGFANFKITP